MKRGLHAMLGLAVLLSLVPTVDAAVRLPHDLVTGGAVGDADVVSFTWNTTALNLTGDIDWNMSVGHIEISAIVRLSPTGVSGANFGWTLSIDGVTQPNCSVTILRTAGQGAENPYMEARCPYTPSPGEHTATFTVGAQTNTNLELVTMIGRENLIIEQSSDMMNVTFTQFDPGFWFPLAIAFALVLMAEWRKDSMYHILAAFGLLAALVVYPAEYTHLGLIVLMGFLVYQFVRVFMLRPPPDRM